jgi:hypothetical protein
MSPPTIADLRISSSETTLALDVEPLGAFEVDPTVRPMRVVVSLVVAMHCDQMSSAEHEHKIQ